MKFILDLLVKFGLRAAVGGAATGVGMPVILGAIAAGLVALSAAAYTAHRKFEGWKEALRTEGRQECVGKINEQALADLQGQLAKKTKEAQEAVQRAAEAEKARADAEAAKLATEQVLDDARASIRTTSTTATVPDAMVDAVNSVVPAKFKAPQPPKRIK